MKNILLACAFLIGSAAVSSAQSATPSSRLGWDQGAPTLADANGYTYKSFADGVAPGVVLTGVTCAGTTSPYACVVNFPAFTPGSHTIQISAANIAGESLPSAPFSFVFVVTPAVPANLRLVP